MEASVRARSGVIKLREDETLVQNYFFRGQALRSVIGSSGSIQWFADVLNVECSMSLSSNLFRSKEVGQ